MASRHDLGGPCVLDERLDLFLEGAVVCEALHQRAVDLHVVRGEVAQQVLRVPPRAEVLDRELESEVRDERAQFLRFLEMPGRKVLADLDDHAAGIDAGCLQLLVQPRAERLVAHRVVRHPHEDPVGIACGAERHRGPDHPAVDVLHEVRARSSGHELRGQDLVALVVEHADDQVEHGLAIADQARDRLLDETEAVRHQGSLDLRRPATIGLLDFRLVRRRLGPQQPIAAGCRRGAAGPDG